MNSGSATANFITKSSSIAGAVRKFQVLAYGTAFPTSPTPVSWTTAAAGTQDNIYFVGVQIQGYAKATKAVLSTNEFFSSMSFYSSAVGNVRLAIYNNVGGVPSAKQWESGSIAVTASAWTTVNISAGTPTSLNLTAGTYWLVWQWNNANNGPSYTAGSAGSGNFIIQSTYGTFPSTWSGGTASSEEWSIYATFCTTPLNKTPTAAASAVCSGTGTNIQIAGSQSGVSYQLRNNSGNTNVGSAVAGTGGTINLPTGNLTTATTYNVLATATAGCNLQMTNTVTVSINPDPTISYTKVFASTCGGGKDGSISVTASGGTSPYTYTWTGYPVAGSYSASTPNISGLAIGDYTIVVADHNLCSATVLGIAIKQTAALHVGTSITIPTCAGNLTNGSISAFRIGGVYDGVTAIEYELSGAATVPYQTSGVFSGLAAGNYTVTVKDSKGCTGSLAVTISADTRPAPTVGFYQPTNPGCSGNGGTISAFRIGGVYDGVNPIEYELSGSATVPYQTSGLFTGLSAGSYTVTVKDSRGCTGVSSTVVLIQPPPLAFTLNGYNTDVSACGGGSDGSSTVTVTGGVPPYSYMLNGVVQQTYSLLTYTIGGLQPNIVYSVGVTDSKGCGITQNVTLSQETAPTALIEYTGNVTCLGGSNGFITTWQSGGVPGYNYSNNGGTTYQGNYEFSSLSAGTYSVIVKDSKGCASAPVSVTINPGSSGCSVGNNNNITTLEDNTSPVAQQNTFSKSLPNSSLRVKAYPNPSASFTDVTLDVQSSNITDKISLIVTDVLGRRWQYIEGNANQQYKLGSGLTTGIYIVQVRQGNNIQTLKIVKE